jgi:hypothetical protein
MNPDACEHDHTVIQHHHPYAIANRYDRSHSINDWSAYMNGQCDKKEGYFGLFCGTCLKGYGSTAPFQCQHCAGADKHGVVSKGTISGLWVYYWVILTAWYVFTVSTSLTGKSRGDNCSGPTPTHMSVGVDTETGVATDAPARQAACSQCGKALATDEKQYHEAGLLDIAKVSSTCIS